LLIKGRVIKVVEKTETEDPEKDDVVVERFRDRFVTTVAALKQDGVQVIQDVQGLSEFMKVYGDKIANHGQSSSGLGKLSISRLSNVKKSYSMIL